MLSQYTLYWSVNIWQLLKHSLSLLSWRNGLLSCTIFPQLVDFVFQCRLLNVTLSKDREQVFHPCAVHHPWKWFQTLLNCGKLKFVSYTPKWWRQVFDIPRYRKLTAKSESWNKRSRQCWTVLPTWQCCPYSLVRWLYEISLANRLSNAWVSYVTALANLLTHHWMSNRPFLPKYKHFNRQLTAYFFLLDKVFVMGEVHNEDSKWTKQTSWKEWHTSGGRACNWIQLRMSAVHFMRMYMFLKILKSLCEWSHSYEESECSFMTSLVCLFCCPWRNAAGRSLRNKCRLCSPCGPQVLRQSTKSRWSNVSLWKLWSVGCPIVGHFFDYLAGLDWCYEGTWTSRQYWGRRYPCCWESRVLRNGSRGTGL